MFQKPLPFLLRRTDTRRCATHGRHRLSYCSNQGRVQRSDDFMARDDNSVVLQDIEIQRIKLAWIVILRREVHFLMMTKRISNNLFRCFHSGLTQSDPSNNPFATFSPSVLVKVVYGIEIVYNLKQEPTF